MCRGVPRNAVVSVGILWGRPAGPRTCGIFVGHPKASGGSRSRAFRYLGLHFRRATMRLGPRGWPAVTARAPVRACYRGRRDGTGRVSVGALAYADVIPGVVRLLTPEADGRGDSPPVI